MDVSKRLWPFLKVKGRLSYCALLIFTVNYFSTFGLAGVSTVAFIYIYTDTYHFEKNIHNRCVADKIKWNVSLFLKFLFLMVLTGKVSKTTQLRLGRSNNREQMVTKASQKGG